MKWLCRDWKGLELIDGPVESSVEVVPGVRMIKAGGHFRGSLMLWWEGKLFIADTAVTVPVSLWFLIFDPAFLPRQHPLLQSPLAT